jgi:anti-sigma B factor antagonist
MIREGLEPPLLTVGTATEGDAAVIFAVGELDLNTAPILFRRVAESLERGRTQLVFDLAGVSFCDSTGLSVFVRAKNRCDRVDGVVRLAALQPEVLQLFEITGLIDVFETFPTVADAMNATPPPPPLPTG